MAAIKSGLLEVRSFFGALTRDPVTPRKSGYGYSTTKPLFLQVGRRAAFCVFLAPCGNGAALVHAVSPF